MISVWNDWLTQSFNKVMESDRWLTWSAELATLSWNWLTAWTIRIFVCTLYSYLGPHLRVRAPLLLHVDVVKQATIPASPPVWAPSLGFFNGIGVVSVGPSSVSKERRRREKHAATVSHRGGFILIVLYARCCMLFKSNAAGPARGQEYQMFWCLRN